VSNQRIPVLTVILLAINILIAYWVAFNPDILFKLGFQADAPVLYTVITSLFVHANILHLLSNLLFLAAVGPAVEAATGVWRFLCVYFGGGLVGILAHWVFMHTLKDQPPLIGASACIASCIGYYCIRYLSVHVVVAPKVGVPVIAVTAVWFLLQIAGAFITIGPESKTAYWAHLGGFCMGILLSLFFKAPVHADQQLGHREIDRLSDRSSAAQLHASLLHLSKYPDDIRAIAKRLEAHYQMGDTEHEAEGLLKLLELIDGEDQRAIMARIVQLGKAQEVAGTKRLMFAEKWKAEDAGLSKALLLSIMAEPSEERRPDAIAEYLAMCDVEEKEQWKIELLERYPMHPATDLAKKKGLL
jgi:membrane associated rhomboid family serine protease